MESLAKAVPLSKTIEVAWDGLTFPVVTWGAAGARPILLLHGFPQEPASWAPVAEALAHYGCQAFAPVQRGYAASTRPRPTGQYTFSKFVADAIGIADILGLHTFDVAGFGVGAVQAWMLAAHHPTRIRSLSAFRYPHPAAFANSMKDDPEQQEKWFRVQQELGGQSPEKKATEMLANDAAKLRHFLESSGLPQPFLDRYVSRLQEPEALAGALKWNQAISLDEFATVPSVTTPTLYVWSEGPALARAAAEATKHYVRGQFTEVCVSDVGHWMLEDAPTAVAALLRRHLHSTT